MKKVLLMMVCALIVMACGSCKEKPQESSKELPASAIQLAGKHANLFKVAGDTKVNLVETNDGWQVRSKITITNRTYFDQLRENNKYERELTSIYGNLLNSSDVEITSLEISCEELNMLLTDKEGEEITLPIKTYSYHHYTYEEAKEIFDKTTSIELKGIELKEKKNDSSNSIFDEDTKEMLKGTKEIIEMEGELLNALGGLL